jgi:hypothetical protein
MDLIWIVQLVVGLLEERGDHRLEAPVCEGPKTEPTSPAADILEKSIDP